MTAHQFPRVITLAKLWCALILLTAWAAAVATARGQVVEARAAGVSGKVLITRTAGRVSTLRGGEPLAPGDVIDTSAGGRVRLELNDGSIVIVHPGTRLILQDYNTAGSLRQLLKIFVGRVRIKINRFGTHGSPYRVNSPSASIGVRGTEFSVSVGGASETEIVVYEGLVEVTSLSDPQNRVIVGPGRGVIVRPNEPIHFFIPGLDREIGERGDGANRDETAPVATGRERDESLPGTASGLYERYIDTWWIAARSRCPPGSLPFRTRISIAPRTRLSRLNSPRLRDVSFYCPLLPASMEAKCKNSLALTLYGRSITAYRNRLLSLCP